MLSKIRCKNYRNLNLGDGLELGPLNIFVGPNGSGKSNLIRILQFVQSALFDQPEDRRGVTGFENAIANFGYGRIANLNLELPSIVNLELEVCSIKGLKVRYELELDVKDARTVSIRKEALSRISSSGEVDHTFYEAHVPLLGDCSVTKQVEGKLTTYNLSDFPSNELALKILGIVSPDYIPFEYLSNSTIDLDGTSLKSGRKAMLDNIGYWSFHSSTDISARSIKLASPQLGAADSMLSTKGENLLVVLNNLITDNIAFEEILTQSMTELFPDTKRVRVLPVGNTSLMLEWHRRGQKRPIYLNEMSDGTVMMLCWCAVLLTPKLSSLIFIDEPEADLHAAWLRVLAGWITVASRSSQVIIATHSPELLDYFTDSVESIKVFATDPNSETSNVVRSLDRDKFKTKLDNGWKIGDIYRSGDPTFGGWPW